MRAMAASGNAEWRTLPPAAYSCAEIFELEKEKIFRPGWILIGRVDQVKSPGDYCCVDVLGEPLVMTRDQAGALRVLSRVCRHRWMEVCEGSGNARSLVCPYHMWVYGLDGALRSAPEMDKTPGFSRQGHGLTQLRHEVWQGFVFVNLSGTAEPLTPRLEPLAEQIKEYDLASWVLVRTLEFGECPWDWKVFHDNGDCYHHIGIHRKTAEPEFPLRGAWDAPNNGNYTLLYCRTHPDYLMAGDDGQPVMATLFKPMRGLSQQQRECFSLFYVLPNYACLVYADCAFVYRVFPVGAGRIRLSVDIIVPAETAAQPDLALRLAECEERFQTVHAEDVRACTSVQRGLQSAYAEAAPYSHREGHNREVALWIARLLTT